MRRETRVKKAWLPDAFIDNLELAWNDVDNQFCLEAYLTATMKWFHSQAHWASAFSGSNDRGDTPQFEDISTYLQKVAGVYPVSLISVIGGSFFLDLVARVEFARIILFDQNVVEFAKISALCNILNRAPDRDPFDELEREITSAPDQLLPSVQSSRLSVRLGPNTDWQFEGRREPGFPLMLRKATFPEYAWRANEDDRRRALANMRRALAKSLFFSVPKIDAAGHLIVVNCSNADPSQLSDAYIRSRITNAAGILIIRSIVVTENSAALDPHPYWEAIARSQCSGQSHQLWAPEDAECLDTPLDETTHTSSILGEQPLPSEADTLLCHILSGKCQSRFPSRYALIRQTLFTLPPRFSRVVVAEFRPEGPVGRRLPAGFHSSEDFTNFYAAALPQFQLTRTVYAPGADDDQRNMFLVFDRLSGSSDNGLQHQWTRSLGIANLHFIAEEGFYLAENHLGGKLRWSRGKAHLLIPEQVDAMFDALILRLWPLHPVGHRFSIKVNSQVVFAGTVDDSGGFSGTVTFPLQQIRRIDIESEVNIYRGDNRTLGIALRQFELASSGTD